MRYWQITGPVRQKDGSERVETQIVPSIEPLPGAEELPRLPRFQERWLDGAFVLDEEALADHEEDARLRRLSPRERQREAVEEAERRILRRMAARDLPSAGE